MTLGGGPSLLSAPTIEVVPNGGLGNRMFQLMLAKRIQERVPGAAILGSPVPEFGTVNSEVPPPSGPTMSVAGHRFDLDAMSAWLAGDPSRRVVVGRVALRMQYYEAALAETRREFSLDRATGIDFSRVVVIHVRMNGIYRFPKSVRPVHADYPILPHAWYDAILSATDRQPVFVGEFGKDVVTQALRRRFPKAEFVRHDDATEDFRLLYSAEHIVLSPSSFSWLAAWLSPYAKSIVLPLAGFLNPAQRPDVDLLPLRDPRYSFWRFPVEKWSLSADKIERVMRGAGGFEPIDAAEAARMLAAANAAAA